MSRWLSGQLLLMRQNIRATWWGNWVLSNWVYSALSLAAGLKTSSSGAGKHFQSVGVVHRISCVLSDGDIKRTFRGLPYPQSLSLAQFASESNCFFVGVFLFCFVFCNSQQRRKMKISRGNRERFCCTSKKMFLLYILFHAKAIRCIYCCLLQFISITYFKNTIFYFI